MPTRHSGIKILFYTHNLELAGACWSLYYIVCGLKERGYGVSVISPRKGPLKGFYSAAGVDIRIVRDIEKAYIRSLFNDNYDLVFVNTILGHPFVQRAHKENIKIIWCIRESEYDQYCEKIDSIGLENFTIPDRIIFVSRATEEIYSELAALRSTVIHNGLDLEEIDKFIRDHSKDQLRNHYRIPDDATVVLLPGTVCRRKGQMEFVHAASMVRTNCPSSSILFISVGMMGERPYYNRIQKIISEEVLDSMVLLLPETERIFDYYLMSDIFVCNSYIESFPRVVLEAMAFSLPIIATDVYGIPEQIRGGAEGFLIMAGDVPGLTEKIEYLVRNKDRGQEMGRAARKRCEKEFSLDKMLDAYEKEILSVINHG